MPMQRLLAERLADWRVGMARKRLPSRLHLLSVREVQTATGGDRGDGGGLMLRVQGDSATWVLRYTASNGKRREMGLGTANRSSAQAAGKSLTDARARERCAATVAQGD